MIVDVDPRLNPLGILVGCFRQGEHCRRPTPRSGLSVAGQFAEWAVVEHFQAFTDGGVGLCQTEEGPVAKSRQDEALDDLNADLRFRLVFWTTNAGRDDGGPIMLRQGGIGRVELWLIAAGFGNADS